MGRKWGANITRHLKGGQAPITEAHAERINAEMRKSEAERDLTTVADLLASVQGPVSGPLREAMAIARRWETRRDTPTPAPPA